MILIGYRGTGKSSIGKRLARRLQTPFYDTDDLIETAAGKSIREIVAEGGWDDFRKIEKKVIHELPVRHKAVVATGGGAVMDEENAKFLKNNGMMIWLYADVKTILQRIDRGSTSGEKRPSLSGDDVGRETVAILEKRTPVYKSLADFSINTGTKNIEEIVDEICQWLDSRTAQTVYGK